MLRFPSIVRAVALAAALGGCSSGVGANAPSPLVPAAASQPISDTTSSQTYALNGGPQVLILPTSDTCSGRVTLPAIFTAPRGTSVTVTTSLTAPAGSTLFPSSIRPQMSGQLSVLCYLTFNVSNTITLPTLPGFAVTVAPTISTASPMQFFYAVSDPTVTGVGLDLRAEGPALVSGQTLTFAVAPYPQTLIAHKDYIFGFYGKVEPTAAATRLYVANAGNDSVSVFDIAHGNAPLPPITGGGLSRPEGIAVDASGKLYVTNSYGNTLSIFDTERGNAALPAITCCGLDNVAGVAADANGRLYVVNGFDHYDPHGDSVVAFDTLHGNAGIAITSGLDFPQGAALDPAAALLYVVNDDSGQLNGQVSYSVSVFDTRQGFAVGLSGITGGGLSGPVGVAVDISGKVYVTNTDNIVSVFDTPLHHYAPLTAISGGGLNGPAGAATDANGRLYVANGQNNSLSVFDLAHQNAALPAITGGGLNSPSAVAIH